MGFLDYILEKREEFLDDSDKINRQIQKLEKSYQGKQDPWGLNFKTMSQCLKLTYPLYKNYFKVRVHGLLNIPKDSPYIVVANHSGQIPIDGLLTLIAFVMENDSPVILRAMAERFLFRIPFLGKIALESGTILGDRKNCRYLLNHGESILVFPEGVKGISKSSPDFYKLQNFTLGFYRLAIEKKVPIIPLTIVGAEEFYPYVYHNQKLAALLGVPALPITPLFPLAGPLGAIPLPSPVDIHIGEVIHPNLDLDPNAPNKEIDQEVQKIKNSIQTKINQSLRERQRNQRHSS